MNNLTSQDTNYSLYFMYNIYNTVAWKMYDIKHALYC